jgi:hypothetical protein
MTAMMTAMMTGRSHASLWRRLAAAAAVALPACGPAPALAAGVPPAAKTAPCPVPEILREVDARLPNLRHRLRAHETVTIVAIGGASTIGDAAGSPALSYPQRLQQNLAALYPDIPITVVNASRPRESAAQMVARFPSAVLDLHPALAIWETGISDAVRGVDIDQFAAALDAGIDMLHAHDIDVVLVDMQFSRRADTIIDFEQYLSTLHSVAEMHGVYVFPRFALMRYWSEANVFDFDDVAAGERARFAARVYDCLGRALAHAVHRGVD